MAENRNDKTHPAPAAKPGDKPPAGQAKLDVLYNVEGERKPRSGLFEADATVGDLLGSVRASLGQDDLADVYLEDEAQPLAATALLSSFDVANGRLFHIARPGEVAVEVVFNAQHVTDGFRPSATMDAVIRWAVAGLGLEGSSADFQLKHGEDVLAPRDHVGQVAKGQKAIRLHLVMKIKPQGSRDDA